MTKKVDTHLGSMTHVFLVSSSRTCSRQPHTVITLGLLTGLMVTIIGCDPWHTCVQIKRKCFSCNCLVNTIFTEMLANNLLKKKFFVPVLPLFLASFLFGPSMCFSEFMEISKMVHCVPSEVLVDPPWCWC